MSLGWNAAVSLQTPENPYVALLPLVAVLYPCEGDPKGRGYSVATAQITRCGR